MKPVICLSVAVILFFACAESKTAAEWTTRSIYQILTDRFARDKNDGEICKDWNDYCGGTWKGIQNNLDYIQGMGFNAIWISPIPHNFHRGYHGYWADDLTQINKHFGSEQDLKNLVNECHKRNIWVMVDVVANHMYHDSISKIVPFGKPEHYHACGNCPKDCSIENWGNQWEVEHCRLTGMPDLNQTNPFVFSTLNAWIAKTVQTYGFDAIRIDTVPEVSKSFWKVFAQKSGVFSIGEALDARYDYVGGYQLPKGPLDSMLSYPNYFTMKEVYAYKSKNMRDLSNVIKGYSHHFGNINHIGTFLDCHDQPRFRSFNNDIMAHKSALAHTLFSFGIPMIYYGTEQQLSGGTDPNNREPLWHRGFNTNNEVYKFLKVLNKVRSDNTIWKSPQNESYVDEQIFAFTRGNVFVATTNVGSGGPTVTRTISYHPFKEGQTLCNVFWPQSDCVKVTKGSFPIVLTNGEPKIFVPQ